MSPHSRNLAASLLLMAFVAASSCSQQKLLFRSDPVITNIDDNVPIAQPQPRAFNRLAYSYDVLLNRQLDDLIDPIDPPPAMNVNALERVPNSSWFTNRLGTERLSIQQVANGPGSGDGTPQSRVPWKVTEISVGHSQKSLTIEDNSGEVYVLQFDRSGVIEASTASEVIASRLLYAAGYNVLESHIVTFNRADILSEAVDSASIDQFLAACARTSDNRYRATAIRRPAGVDVGPFSFTGTRTDDPNDLIAHQHRRELRALKMFAAWLGDVEITPDNCRDYYIAGEQGSFVKHFITGFDDCFGSYFLDNTPTHPGFDYLSVDMAEIAGNSLTFGLLREPWEEIQSKSYSLAGPYYESRLFRPDKWKPIMPVPLFSQMTPQDAFWAATIIASFGDDHISTAVNEGQISSQTTKQDLMEQLKLRRDKILSWAFSRTTPLDGISLEFKKQGLVLGFTNLAEKYAIAPRDSFEYRISVCDQKGSVLGKLDMKPQPQYILPERQLKLPETDGYVVVEISVRQRPSLEFLPPVRAHFWGGKQLGFKLVGVERQS